MLGVGDIFIIFFYFIAFLYIRTVNTEYLSKEISHEISFYLTGQKITKIMFREGKVLKSVRIISLAAYLHSSFFH